MIRKIVNVTVHLVSLNSCLVHAYETVVASITSEEMMKYKDTIEVYSVETNKKIFPVPLGPVSVEDVEQKLVDKVELKGSGIISEQIVDDYLKRNTRSVIKSLEDDKHKLTIKDASMLLKYENNHKHRKSVLDKLKNLGGG